MFTGRAALLRIFMRRRFGNIAAVAALAALSGCTPHSQGGAKETQKSQAEAKPAARAAVEVPPPAAFAAEIAGLGNAFPGVVGIAVRDIQSGWTASYAGGARFPQQSVSKLWVAISVLDALDRGALTLSDPVVVREADLTLFHQPIRYLIGPDGYHTTIGSLLATALTRSDNTANDMLLRRIGGPDAVRRMIARKNLGAIAFGQGERLLQSQIAGLSWRPEYAIGSGFADARAALPLAIRSAALDQYLARPMDGAAPDAIVGALARLHSGELLSPTSTALLLGIMQASRTGPRRLRGGLAPGWSIAHKTGTGQELAGRATGFNDIGLLTAPDGRTYAIAVMIGSTRQPIPARLTLMGDVTRAVESYHAKEGGRGERVALSRTE